ncbi:MAG TPA: ABC transporter permease [Polyangiaceae bacterium]|nr:ABC transporter permease [Polyangiaceae bacterium]
MLSSSLSPLAEIRLIAVRELRRSIRSTKGVAIAALTLAGACIALLVSGWMDAGGRELPSAEVTQAQLELRRQAIAHATGDPAFADDVASMPTSLLAFLKITVWFSPLLVALLGFDGISGELQHRTVRFWAVRARRSSLFAGKLLGLWALVGLVTLALNLLAGGAALARGHVAIGELARWGVRSWFVVFVIAGAWAAMATLVSACFSAPILALLATFAAFFVLWLVGLGGFLSRMRLSAEGGAQPAPTLWYEFLYPNAYDTLLMSSDPARVLGAAGILIAFVAIATGAGSLLLARRDM